MPRRLAARVLAAVACLTVLAEKEVPPETPGFGAQYPMQNNQLINGVANGLYRTIEEKAKKTQEKLAKDLLEVHCRTGRDSVYADCGQLPLELVSVPGGKATRGTFYGEGRYRFQGLAAGEQYQLNLSSKRYKLREPAALYRGGQRAEILLESAP